MSEDDCVPAPASQDDIGKWTCPSLSSLLHIEGWYELLPMRVSVEAVSSTLE